MFIFLGVNFVHFLVYQLCGGAPCIALTVRIFHSSISLFSSKSRSPPPPILLATPCEMYNPHPVLMHLGCCRKLLAKSVGKEQEHAMASHVQMEAMKHRIKQADIGSIDPEMKARIFTMLQACAFTEGDRLQLMELLSPKQAEGQQKEQKQQRLPMQTLFPMLLEYFTEEEWSQMRKPTMSAAMHMVMARAIALGARNPSERCCASITSLLLHVCGMAEINMTARQ